jgi:hypothetical protein
MAKYEYDNIPRTQSETRRQAGILRDGKPWGKVHFERVYSTEYLMVSTDPPSPALVWRWTLHAPISTTPLTGVRFDVDVCSADVLAWLNGRDEKEGGQ